jgi:hypothetical protein
MLVANIGTTLLYLALVLSPVGLRLLLPSIASWTIYLFTILGAWNTVCVCFLFLWKKWAFFGVCGSAAVALIVNLDLGVGAFALLGLAGIVVLYLVLRPKWSLLDNL